MDDAPEAFPYRCLPLNIANSHGWEILSTCGFEAVWNGGMAPEDVVIRADPGSKVEDVPQALFGQGTFTIHLPGLLRTPPGWNLYVSGAPNIFKDGVAPLAGIIETDWSPYSFTINWRLTRPHMPVRFEENEPVAHFFPIQREAVERFEPTFAPIGDDPHLKEMFEKWSASRDAFQRHVREHPPERPTDKWQKLYFRGLDPDGHCPVADHRVKLRVGEFDHAELTGQAVDAMKKPIAAEPREGSAIGKSSTTATLKYEWLLAIQEQQRALSAVASDVPRCRDITGEQFLDLFYAPSRPVILSGEIREWPACTLWSPKYLAEKIGNSVVQYQGGRTASGNFERHKEAHRSEIAFDTLMQIMEKEPGNGAYITAFNASFNSHLLETLQADTRNLDKYLTHSPDAVDGMMWIGPEGTFTPLHHDLTNNLFVQVVGRKKVIMAPANHLPNMYNDVHVFSRISDIDSADIDLDIHDKLKNVQFYELIVEPGDCLFIPVGWWHQVRALDFSVSITYTNFKWRNDFYKSYPQVE